ncbi:hypothetical protein J6TS2_03080 [Heyndrickxia sporothermodurans]|nr:hypothetical protein J6TS2_03080 [Heyndrickxia sporothermodurans]
MYSDTITKKKYLRLIHLKREEMINLGNQFGLTDEKTITCSQELDELLNEFQQFQETRNKQNIIREMSFIIYKCKPINNKRIVRKSNILNVI